MSISIAFFSTKAYERHAFEMINTQLPFGFPIKFFAEILCKGTVALAKSCEVVCAFTSDLIDADVVQQLYRNGTRLLAMRCTGFNNVDLQAAAGKIQVVRATAYSPESIAEYALGLMLMLNRGYLQTDQCVHKGDFVLPNTPGNTLSGKTIGVVGTGSIGRAMVHLLSGFDATILAYDVFQDADFAKTFPVTYTTFEHLLEASDIITLHCPLTADNRHMIHHASIARMKRGVCLVNTARGGLIDTDALIEGLQQGQIGAAALDVYENEQNCFWQDTSRTIDDLRLQQLLSMPNVFISPHQAFFTHEALKRMATITFESIQAYIQHEPLQHEVKAEGITPHS